MTMSDLVVVMNAGRIEQIGGPLDVYRRPASAFVARFIGTTNLLTATRGSDGVLRVAGREFTVSGDGGAGDAVLSVRPEDAQLVQDEPPVRNALPGTVVFVRDLGEMFECYVDCGLEANVVVAGSPRERVRVQQGQRVTVSFPVESCIVVSGNERS
jgi:putative spermidine/putrescine transport system ATP-binding protein